jgi:hypothetical protein
MRRFLAAFAVAISYLQRRLRVEIYLPFVEVEFLKESINFAGEHWREKFFWVKERVQGWHVMPQELGPYAHWRRLLCLRQPVDARSSTRLCNRKSQLHLPVGWSDFLVGPVHAMTEIRCSARA